MKSTLGIVETSSLLYVIYFYVLSFLTIICIIKIVIVINVRSIALSFVDYIFLIGL